MDKSFDRFIVNFVVVATFVAYFQIFKFTFVPSAVQVLAQLGVIGMLALLIIVRVTYFRGTVEQMNFKGPVLLLLFGAIPSLFIAYYYHKQSFIYSLLSSRILLFYLLYFFLHLYRVQIKVVLRTVLYIGLFAVLLYYIQMAIYPKLIMNIQGSESRGTIRLFVPGMMCTIAAYFYFLNKFFETNNSRLFIFTLLTFSVFILQGTRQLIFSTIFLTLVNIMLSNRVRSKVLMVFLITLASFAVFMVFRDIFLAIFEVSSSQSENVEGDMRVRAATFFLTDFMPSNYAYLFGNSIAESGSPYHVKTTFYATKYGFFLSDIGIIGDYVRYGVIFTIAAVYIIIKSLTFKVSNEYKFLKYYIAAQCFTLLTGKGFIGGADIIFASILYIFDMDRANELNNKIETLKHKINHHG